jgi:fumarate hydratase class II
VPATRTETDSFGPIEVPADCYWGAQTARSIGNFPFGATEEMSAHWASSSKPQRG